MGAQQTKRQNSALSDAIKSSQEAARAEPVVAKAVADANAAIAEAEKVAAAVLSSNVGPTASDPRSALMQSQEYAEANQKADRARRVAEQAVIAQKQAEKTAAALARLAGRKSATSEYSCPDFKSCTGNATYNVSRARGIANDYNRRYARKDKRFLVTAGNIKSAGDNACNVQSTFMDTVTREYIDKSTDYQYECDKGRGWQLTKVTDVESMVGGLAY